jgi:hypothetical protein
MPGSIISYQHSVENVRLPNHRFAPVGHCIYCGAIEGKLGEEHIWPDGLGGHLILPAASCTPCEVLINKFETSVMRRNMGLVRKSKGIYSRKKRSKPREATYEELRLGVRNPVAIRQNMPTMIIAEVRKRRSSIISGIEDYDTSLRISGNVGDRSAPGQGLALDIEFGAFSRFLAKVAHSYATACLGVNGFQPFLPPLILGRESAVDSRYIGEIDAIPSTNIAELKLDITDDNFWYLPGLRSKGSIAKVTLSVFSQYNEQAFEVAVGRILS